ncbi:MAG TPA: hypothetical protein VG276_29010 [Actinomycetes bacterium]|jgi:hypothetical protein|nr:hypothetical protein [Actinomycetes bacterium]
MFEATRQAMAARRHDRPRRRSRIGVWVVLLYNVLFAWWLVAASVRNIALSALVLVLWVVFDVVAVLVYLLIRARR